MRTTIKNTIVLVLLFLFSVCLSLPCFAATQQGKISVTLEDKQNNKIKKVKNQKKNYHFFSIPNYCKSSIIDEKNWE